MLELGKLRQVDYAVAADRNTGQLELLEVGQPGDRFQTDVGQPRAGEVQGFEARQFGDPCQAQVGDSAVGQFQFLQCRQPLERADGVVTDTQAGQVEHTDVGRPVELRQIRFDQGRVEFESTGLEASSGEEDLDPRQCLRESHDPRQGHLAVAGQDSPEFFEWLELGQAFVANLCLVDPELPQPTVTGQGSQAVVGDLGAREAQTFDPFEPPELVERGVGEPRLFDVDGGDFAAVLLD